MKRLILLSLLAAVATSQSAIIDFDLSPAGTDSAVGLSPLNEAPPATNSIGSGNEISPGITLDTDTLTLTLSIGYGSAFGFTNLTGAATGAHIHGLAPTNTAAPALIDLGPLHVLATNPADGGSISGTIVLTTEQASNLLAGLFYVNIQTESNPNGEIRGQLIPVTSGLSLTCPEPITLQCAGSEGAFAELTAEVSDAEGAALTVIWSVNGVALQTNDIPESTSSNASPVTFQALYSSGTNVITVSVASGSAETSCSTTVTVLDTLPPVIQDASVTPDVLWPPNHKMVPVEISIVSTDLCGTATCRIISIRSNQPDNARGSGNTAPDWKITGDLTAALRAERSGKDKNGRVYTITVECTDEAGNAANTNLVVTVPHDQRQYRQLHQGGNHDNAGHGKNNQDKGNHDNGKNKGKGANGDSHGNGKGNGHGKKS